MTYEDRTAEIKNLCLKKVSTDLLDNILSNESFKLSSGASTPERHHYGDGGLQQHTLEVLRYCHSIVSVTPADINQKVLFTAVLYHDFGKTYDYSKDPEGKWGKTEHYSKIGHVVRSCVMWQTACEKFYIDPEFANKVLHCIVSHHQFKEWGSPKEPQTKEAWILHLADMLSAKLAE